MIRPYWPRQGRIALNNGTICDVPELARVSPSSVASYFHNPATLSAMTREDLRIGDAVASRNVHAAMLDVARVCRAI